MKKQILKILSVGVILSFVLTACSSKPKDALAKVGKEYITAEEINNFYNDYLAQNAMYMDPSQFDESTEEGKANANQLRGQVLDSIVYEKTAVNLAKEKKVKVSDEELDQSLRDFIEQVGGEEALEKALKSSNTKRDKFEEDYKKTIKSQTYITKLTEKLREELKLSEKELDKEIKKDEKEYFPSYNADHILFSVMKEDGTSIEDEAEKAKIKEEAQVALDSIKTKEDFQKKFDEINVDPEKKPTTASETSIMAEELGDFAGDAMVEPFSKAVAGMEKDTISTELVETDFGYHIIKLNSKATSMEDAEKDYANDVKSKVETNVVEQKISDTIEEAKEKLGVKFFKADGKEAKNALEAIESFDFSKLNEKNEEKDNKKEEELKDTDKSTEKETEETNTTQTTQETNGN